MKKSRFTEEQIAYAVSVVQLQTAPDQPDLELVHVHALAIAQHALDCRCIWP